MPSRFDRWKTWSQLVFRVNQYDGICSKTFEFEDDAINLYLVEADQMIPKDVRAMYPASTRYHKDPILN
jgi:hypothetical protein